MRYIWGVLTLIMLCVPVMAQNSGQHMQLRVSISPRTINIERERSATVTIQVLGARVSGVPVFVTSDRGKVVPPYLPNQSTNGNEADDDGKKRVPRGFVTDQSGVASGTLHVGANDLGEVTVTATVRGGSTATATAIVTNYAQGPSEATVPEPELMVEAPELPADGQSATRIFFRLLDWNGGGVPNQVVNFATTAGRIQQAAVTDRNGVAAVNLVAPTMPGSATITATAGTIKAMAEVKFTQMPQLMPSAVAIDASVAEAPADGKTQVMLRAAVYDAHNRLLTNVPVVFVPSAGVIERQAVLTDGQGVAITTLIAPSEPEKVKVTAVAMGLFNVVEVEFTQPGTPGTEEATSSM